MVFTNFLLASLFCGVVLSFFFFLIGSHLQRTRIDFMHLWQMYDITPDASRIIYVTQ